MCLVYVWVFGFSIKFRRVWVVVGRWRKFWKLVGWMVGRLIGRRMGVGLVVSEACGFRLCRLFFGLFFCFVYRFFYL